METHYPIRRGDNKNADELNKIMLQLQREKHGRWLSGSNGMWHGGIHISRNMAPQSLINPQDSGNAVPLQCMAGGEIVAWRVGEDYFPGKIGDTELKYSTSFLLVRSVHKPAEDNSTWLTFYTLYMHLAPLSSYPKRQTYRITRRGNGLKMRQYNGNESSGQDAPAVVADNYLKSGDQIQVEQQKTFLLSNKQPELFGLAQKIQNGTATGSKFWTSIRPDFAAPEGEQYGSLPGWMSEAIKEGKYDEVVCPSVRINIEAGDPIGFLGRDDAPGKYGAITTDWFTHIEVTSNDGNMPGFLTNPGHLETGQRFVLIREAQQLYHAEEKATKRLFEPMNVFTTRADTRQIISLEAAQPWEDEGVMWYKIRPHTWIRQDGVDVVNQNELSRLKFMALEQEPARNFQQSLAQKWVSSAFRWISGETLPEQGLESRGVSENYAYLADKLDLNQDGKVSAQEMDMYRLPVEHGLRNRDPEIDFLLRRLVVKHESEWYGDSAHPKWQRLLETLSGDNLAYARQWLDAHEWMSKVPALSKDEAVWHFHPVEFLDVLGRSTCACGRDLTIDEMQKIVVNVKVEKLSSYLKELNIGFKKFGIKKCRAKAHFLSQLLHESGHFNFTSEINGANTSYQPWFGRGLIQITLRDNYKKYGEYIGEDVVSSDAARDKLTTLPHSVLSAFWYYEVSRKLDVFSAEDDFNKITAVINGGFNGYNDRLSIFNTAVKVLGAEHLNKNNDNGTFSFQHSSIYQNKIYSLAWGIWHDPASRKKGTIKNREEALKGYKRAQELIAASPFPANTPHKKIYGIEYRSVLNYVNQRIVGLE